MNEEITIINNIIRAKKLSQLDLIKKVNDVDSSSVVVVVPELDENNECTGKFQNIRITIEDFFKHGISTVWKDVINEYDKLSKDDILPIVTTNETITDDSDPINTRDEEENLISRINKAKGTTLGSIADYIMDSKQLLNESQINQKISSISIDNSEQINTIKRNNDNDHARFTNQLEDYRVNITDNSTQIININNKLKWFLD